MELSYLERLLELLEKLQSAYLQKDYKEVKAIQQQIERHIGSLEKLVDTLRNYQGKHGCRKDLTVRAIEYLSSAQRKLGGSGIYPALWFSFAHENFLSELKRWIKEETNSKIACGSKEDLQNGKTTETEQKNKGGKIMITAGTSEENWEAIRNEYDISKVHFGKKINFVSDKFKRNIIFRDVEHAFVLASQGFSKPAVILAGGVIEELLKQYLRHKKIKPKSDRFVDYIKTCEDKGLLKRGVYRLSDSIRDFRNLVHISKEQTKQHTISKATAKGAVSSIFTIANDFQ
jgi:hypothetical protein